MRADGLHEFKVLEPNNLVGDLVALIQTELASFTKSDEFVNILEKKKNENQHSLSFCVFMTNKCKSKFYFARENAQKGSSVIDIGVYHGADLIFTIEAKLLPTPKGRSDQKRDEHEYVYGKGAGIQRFKDGNHGTDNLDNFLKENAMIGFLKGDDFDFWLQKVNQWIRDANWSESELLEKIEFQSTGKLKSKHSRSNNSDVLLHHFWIKVA
ncbi:MAG: hypothetical protein J0I32_04450 [Sphingobacteriales bacterium]|nr:hypothetical protein [Sphingobacteriales bacterium]OJV98410.1 MAG: hypothetical protein BGO52_11520 [Sphingobacteriales bacterium 44-61]